MCWHTCVDWVNRSGDISVSCITCWPPFSFFVVLFHSFKVAHTSFFCFVTDFRWILFGFRFEVVGVFLFFFVGRRLNLEISTYMNVCMREKRYSRESTNIIYNTNICWLILSLHTTSSSWAIRSSSIETWLGSSYLDYRRRESSVDSSGTAVVIWVRSWLTLYFKVVFFATQQVAHYMYLANNQTVAWRGFACIVAEPGVVYACSSSQGFAVVSYNRWYNTTLQKINVFIILSVCPHWRLLILHALTDAFTSLQVSFVLFFFGGGMS